MKKGYSRIVAALAISSGGAASGQASFKTMPAAGTHHYLYEVIETINGARRDGWRTEFDLVSANGAIDAVVRKSSHFAAAGWEPVAVGDACRTAMHGGADSLARVRLWPMSPQAAHKLDSSFLDTCAPAGIFFPLTDILNVAIIAPSPTFRTRELREIGQALRYPGFEAAFDRAGEAIKEISHGGEVRLAVLDARRAVIDWRPDLADIELTENAQKPPLALKGTEHWAFRVEIDRRSGAIERASTTYDDLDLAIVGAPPGTPRVRISRTVVIERQ
jgi:hypothetical protein